MEDLWDKKLELSCLTFLGKPKKLPIILSKINTGFQETKIR